jgi:multicomponent Na+:H+ antiporter subunit D
MVEWIHPGIVILFGSLLIPFIKWRRVKKVYFLSLPIVGLIILILTSMGVFGTIPSYPDALHKWRIPFLQYTLELGRIDKLSMVFAYVYVIAAFCMNIFALHVKRDWEHVSAMVYVGSSLGAVFAQDIFTLCFFLEIMSVSAAFLVWFRGTKISRGAGFRYLFWHILSGACVLAGGTIHAQITGSIEFVHFPWGWGWDYFGYYLICLGFVINAACAPFHSWLSDAYSDASITGAIYMTAFTTKTGIYCLIRGFSGVELLMWMGAISAVFALFMAVLENDGRRLCSYHIISQLGYMVCGVGLGTWMGINGAASHALCHIIYNALLYMGASCVLQVTGTCKFSETGGLYKYMPISFALYMVGGFSISGWPLFNGFVSKCMTIEGAELLHQPIIYLLLEGATVGTWLHTGIKLPWNLWFQGRKEPPADIKAKLKDSPINTPINMLIGMGILAFLCISIGVYPYILYGMLPHPVEFVPFTVTRVFSIVQLFLFTFIAAWFLRTLIRGTPTYTLDTDWLGRIPGRALVLFCEKPLMAFGSFLDKNILRAAYSVISYSKNPTLTMTLTPTVIGLGLIVILVLFTLLAVFLVI